MLLHSEIFSFWKRIASQFANASDKALDFLEHETADSGIVMFRGGELQFWHLTFQEYLAARAIAGRADADQRRLLLGENRIYLPEWREIALLLAGILIKHGRAKVDGLFGVVLNGLTARSTIVETCAMHLTA